MKVCFSMSISSLSFLLLIYDAFVLNAFFSVDHHYLTVLITLTEQNRINIMKHHETCCKREKWEEFAIVALRVSLMRSECPTIWYIDKRWMDTWLNGWMTALCQDMTSQVFLCSLLKVFLEELILFRRSSCFCENVFRNLLFCSQCKLVEGSSFIRNISSINYLPIIDQHWRIDEKSNGTHFHFCMALAICIRYQTWNYSSFFFYILYFIHWSCFRIGISCS